VSRRADRLSKIQITVKRFLKISRAWRNSICGLLWVCASIGGRSNIINSGHVVCLCVCDRPAQQTNDWLAIDFLVTFCIVTDPNIYCRLRTQDNESLTDHTRRSITSSLTPRPDILRLSSSIHKSTSHATNTGKRHFLRTTDSYFVNCLGCSHKGLTGRFL